jgi:oligoribonuclease
MFPYRVGIDVETTGLVAGTNLLLEIALVVTDLQHNVVRQETFVIPTDSVAAYEQSSRFVQEMHTKNGLWQALYELDAVHERSVFLAALDNHLVEVLGTFGVGPNAKTPLWGYNPGFDLGFLKVDLPKIAACFSHVKADIRSIELICTQLGVPKYKSEDHPHRALGDLLDEFQALAYYAQFVHC